MLKPQSKHLRHSNKVHFVCLPSHQMAFVVESPEMSGILVVRVVEANDILKTLHFKIVTMNKKIQQP